eukprot:4690856-Prymnesium_polylepis.1
MAEAPAVVGAPVMAAKGVRTAVRAARAAAAGYMVATAAAEVKAARTARVTPAERAEERLEGIADSRGPYRKGSRASDAAPLARSTSASRARRLGNGKTPLFFCVCHASVHQARRRPAPRPPRRAPWRPDPRPPRCAPQGLPARRRPGVREGRRAAVAGH